MQDVIINLINDIHKMSYVDFTNIGQEEAFKKILIKNHIPEIVKTCNNASEFTQQHLSLSRKQIQDANELYYEKFKDLRGFIPQPFGSQQSPDILVIINGLLLRIELKSSRTSDNHIIGLNEHIPIDNYLYIFSCKKYKTSNIFFGKDIISEIERSLLKSSDKQIKEISNRVNEQLKNINSSFAYYLRRKIISQGSKDNWVIYGTEKEKNFKDNVLETLIRCIE